MNKVGTVQSQNNITYYEEERKERVSNVNKVTIKMMALYDSREPRFVPSNKSIGTFRYISNPRSKFR